MSTFTDGRPFPSGKKSFGLVIFGMNSFCQEALKYSELAITTDVSLENDPLTISRIFPLVALLTQLLMVDAAAAPLRKFTC